MKKQQASPKLYWTIGTFRDHINGPQYWGVIWDAGGTEVWVGPLRDNKPDATDETAQKMKELINDG